MGFYSFYKIIKDIIRTIFGNSAFRLVLIACICGFLLCFVSDKVQATYISDTNSFFDNTTSLNQNQTTFSIDSISCTIPASYYNYSTILIKPYFANGSITRVYSYYTNGDLKYDFSDNKFYSTDTLYRVQCNVSSNIANFNNITPSEYNVGSGVNALFVAGNTYNSFLFGSIYDNSNNNIIISSSAQEETGELIYYANNKENISFNLYHLKDYYFYFVCTFRYTDRNTDYYTYQLLACDNEFTIDKSLTIPSFVIPTGSKYYQATGQTSNLTNLQNTINTLTLSSSPTSEITYINYSTDMATAYNTISLSNAKVACNFNIKNQNNNTEFPDYFIKNPYFEPSDSEIQALTWDNIFVELGDFDIENNNLYIHCLEVSRTIVGTGAEEPISYYYNDNTIKLKKGNKYWRQLFDLEQYYFSVPLSQFGFKPEKAYFLILTNNADSITSSLGKVNENYYNTIYQIVEINSGNLITLDDVMNNNIEKMGDDVTFLGRTIEESLAIGSENNKQLTDETNEVIDTNINFNNNNSGLDSVRNGFFSRLTNILTNIFDYNVSQVDTIVFPIKDKNIEIRSDMISAYIPSSLSSIIQAMWFFIFNFYLFKFISEIYHSFKTGNILNGFNSKNEVITNDML